jgi:polar amino acid transport system permease protein
MYTIGITLAGFAIALVVGLLLALLRRSRFQLLSWSSAFLIEFIRSTPLLIPLYFLFYVAPEYGLTMSALTAGTIGIGMHYSSYVAEVYRAGLNAVPRGQWEAAKALSLTPWHAYCEIVLPQAIRTIIPVLGNYLVAMFKDTPVLSAITVAELMLKAKNIRSETFRYIEPITMAGMFFLAVSVAVALAFRKIEAHVRLP